MEIKETTGGAGMKDPGDIEVPEWIRHDFLDEQKPEGSFFIEEIVQQTGKAERTVREICAKKHKAGEYERFIVKQNGRPKYAYRPMETPKE